MKRVLFLFTVLLSILCAKAQKVFSTDSQYQADVKVYVVDSEYQADLLVYKAEKSTNPM